MCWQRQRRRARARAAAVPVCLAACSLQAVDSVLTCKCVASARRCTLQYFELAQQVGQRFEFSDLIISIDGYCHPDSSDRLSLGALRGHYNCKYKYYDVTSRLPCPEPEPCDAESP